MKNSKNNQIINRTQKLQAKWTYEAIGDLGERLHEQPLTEEEKIIERLKYTKKELDEMYSRSLEDILTEELSKSIADEINREMLNKIMLESYGKSSTRTR